MEVPLIPLISTYQLKPNKIIEDYVILTSTVDALFICCTFDFKFERTSTDAFMLAKVLISCELLVAPWSWENTAAAFISSEPRPMSTICNTVMVYRWWLIASKSPDTTKVFIYKKLKLTNE